MTHGRWAGYAPLSANEAPAPLGWMAGWVRTHPAMRKAHDFRCFVGVLAGWQDEIGESLPGTEIDPQRERWRKKVPR